MRKIKQYKTITILIALSVVLMVVGTYIKTFKSPENNKNQKSLSVLTPTPTPDPFLHAESFNLPPSYMGYTFSKLTPDKNTLGKTALYYDNKPIGLEGTEWVVTKNNLSDKEYASSIKDFETFTNIQLQKLDWVTEKTIDGHKFSVLSASDPTSNVSGYLKIMNGKIQVILLQTQRDKLQCPCNLEFRIFLSNVYNLQDLIK